MQPAARKVPSKPAESTAADDDANIDGADVGVRTGKRRRAIIESSSSESEDESDANAEDTERKLALEEAISEQQEREEAEEENADAGGRESDQDNNEPDKQTESDKTVDDDDKGVEVAAPTVTRVKKTRQFINSKGFLDTPLSLCVSCGQS